MAKENIRGKEIEGEYVPFTSILEDWNEYKVGNHFIKIKVVVSDIFRAKDATDSQGNPVFSVKSQMVITVRKLDQ